MKVNESINTMNKRTLFAYGVGSLGSGAVSTMVTAYFMFYLTQVQGLSGTIVGGFFLLVRLFDALNDPIMGIIVCNNRTKWGRYRHWILIGGIMSAIFFIMMFFNFGMSTTSKYFYYFCMYVLWSIGATITDIPYFSIIPAVAKSTSERSWLSSISQIFSGLGTVLVMILVPVVFDLFLRFQIQTVVYRNVAIFIGLILAVAMTVTALFVKEKNRTGIRKKIKFSDMIKAVKKNDQAKKLFFPLLLMTIGFSLTLGLGTYFFTYDVGDYGKFSIFMLFCGIGMVFAFLSYPFAIKKFGRKSTFLCACFLCIIGYSFMFISNIVFHGNVWVLSCSALVTLTGYGWFNVAKLVMTSSVCDYSKEKTGKKMESVWISMLTFNNKLAGAITAMLIGVTLDVAGISGLDPSAVGGVASEYGIQIMRILMFIVPIILVVFSVVLYLQFYKLDNKEEIIKETNLRINENIYHMKETIEENIGQDENCENDDEN